MAERCCCLDLEIEETTLAWDYDECVRVLNATVDVYEGPYDVTPTADAQTLGVASQIMAQDITVGPIPSNYGLITWNGATLTVS